MPGHRSPHHSCWFDRWKYFVLRRALWHIQFWQLPEAELNDLTQAVNFQLFIDTIGWKMGHVSKVQTCWEIQGRPISDVVWISDFSYDIRYFKAIIFIECLIFFFSLDTSSIHFLSCQFVMYFVITVTIHSFWAETNLFHVDINWESFLWCQQNDSKTTQVTGTRSSAMTLWLDDGNQIRQTPKSIVMNNSQIS